MKIALCLHLQSGWWSVERNKRAVAFGLWQCSASLLKGSHILPVICRLDFQHVLCLLLKEDGFSAFVGFVFQGDKKSCTASICILNSEPFCLASMCRGYRMEERHFFQSLASFDLFPVMLTKSSYHGENCRWCFMGNVCYRNPENSIYWVKQHLRNGGGRGNMGSSQYGSLTVLQVCKKLPDFFILLLF